MRTHSRPHWQALSHTVRPPHPPPAVAHMQQPFDIGFATQLTSLQLRGSFTTDDAFLDLFAALTNLRSLDISGKGQRWCDTPISSHNGPAPRAPFCPPCGVYSQPLVDGPRLPGHHAPGRTSNPACFGGRTWRHRERRHSPGCPDRPAGAVACLQVRSLLLPCAAQAPWFSWLTCLPAL